MTHPAPSSAPAGAAPRSARALVTAPERVVLVLVILALAAGGWAAVGLHQPWTVLPTAALGAWAAWRIVPSPAAVTAADRRGALAALVGTGVWTVVNGALYAEYLIVVRDPGFLTLAGLWLVHHPSSDIPTLGAIDAAGVDGSVLADASQAWNLRGDAVQPQGARMLSALIAVGGWLGGDHGVLVANVVVGAVGILAVYALARRVLGPLAALAPAAAVALSVSHIGLSRAAYTEPLTLVLALAAALWLWRGVEERSTGALLLGAAAAGATSFIRIDGALIAAGLLAATVLALALTEGSRRRRTRDALSAIGLQAAVLYAGYAALWRWSEGYADRLADQGQRLMAGYGLLAVVLAAWALTWLAGGDRLATGTWRLLRGRGAIAAGAGVAGLLLLLASRPLWMVARRSTTDPVDQFTNSVVESFQRAQGLPVDPTRTYYEQSVAWLSYYLTWPLVLLGILGFALITVWMVRRRPGWALLLGAVMPSSLLYFWNAEVVPDQIWAFRRFEPVTLPGFAIAAAVAAWWIVDRLRPSWRLVGRRVAAGAFVVLPLTTWVSIQPASDLPVSGATPVFVREMGGAYDQIRALCDVAPDRPIILAGTSSHFGSLRVMCDEPTVLQLAALDPSQVADMASAWDTAPVVLTRSPDWFDWTADPEVVVTSTVRQASYQLQAIPRTYFDRDYAWYAGIVNDDGTLTPVAPGAAAAGPADTEVTSP
ncbi:glycosyltransferase family 39 protein [Demequina soli]|uniref:glycosyltransferase family 39 protein n=1 Tax=Demequina soli TaxID=1638987 RepID=UPI0012E07C7D|nr:glycosyltransferase family 39 protein [Demequina soli]